jgi:hypothetical protein
MPGASLSWQLAPLSDCTRYGVQALVKAWQYIPFWHVIFAGPQAHVAFVCCSVWQYDRAFGAALCLCPFASAKPTDMAVTSNAIAKVFSMVCSSLDYAMKLYMSNNVAAKSLDSVSAGIG